MSKLPSHLNVNLVKVEYLNSILAFVYNFEVKGIYIVSNNWYRIPVRKAFLGS